MFIVPFYNACKGSSPCLLGLLHRGLKRKRDRETDREIWGGGDLLSLQGVASSSLRNHGGVGLDRVGGHARAPSKSRELGVYDGDRAHDLPRSQGSHSPHSGGGGGDMSWHARHSMSRDLVFQHIDFSALCCSSMAWNYITCPS
jgi:hypothetical protein